jgi:hypothetical protein
MYNAQPFAAGVGSSFNNDSPALSSDRTSRDTVKVLNEVKSPLIQMSEFFAGIDIGIIKLVDIAKQSLGLDKASLQLESRIADIMASDLALEEKQNLANQLRGRDANIAGEDTDTSPGEKPEKISFIDSLKKAFADLTDNQTIGELGKIFLFATGAMALAKFAVKFQDEVAGVLKYISEKVIPGFKELDEGIRESDTGYLGLGGAISASFYRVMGAFGRIVKIGSVGALKFVDDIILSIRKFFVAPAQLLKLQQLQSVQMVIKSLTGPTSFLGKIGAFISKIGTQLGKVAVFIAKFPGIAQILGMTGAIAKFLGPIGLIIQGIVGTTQGLINAVKVFKESGSIINALGAFVEGFFDAVVGATANLLADVVGFIVKKLGMEELGKKIMGLDFSLDSIMTGIQNALYTVMNSFIRLYNIIAPKALEIDLFEMKQSKVSKEKEIDSAITTQQIETNKTINEEKSFLSSEINNKDLVINNKETNSMAMKTEILKSTVAANEKLPPSQKGNQVYMDNKQVTGGTTVNNSKTVVSNQRVESTDRATKELNAVYGYASA